MSNVLFTADLHLGHYSIIQKCNRPFTTLEEMHETIIDRWNSVVESPRDKIVVLGDFSFKIKNTKVYFDRLKGYKFLIVGNHDERWTKRLPWGWVKDTMLYKGLNEHGIWLSHYPHRSWRSSFRGSWHLYGHTHSKLQPYGMSFDVGVDSWNFTPVPVEIVREKMDELKNNPLKVL
jgi:calcineurin-like phosphoesterase family protein